MHCSFLNNKSSKVKKNGIYNQCLESYLGKNDTYYKSNKLLLERDNSLFSEDIKIDKYQITVVDGIYLHNATKKNNHIPLVKIFPLDKNNEICVTQFDVSRKGRKYKFIGSGTLVYKLYFDCSNDLIGIKLVEERE